MLGYTRILNTRYARQSAHALIDAAPQGSVVTVRQPTRTDAQNRRLWALLSDIALAKPQGRKMSPDAWKCLFLAACGHKCLFEPSLDGEGVVPLGFKSSRLSVAEMADVLECIQAFGDEHGVRWTEPQERAARWATGREPGPGPRSRGG